MFRHVLAMLALPLTSLAAQASLVRVTITSANNAEFRLLGLSTDSSVKPISGRGRGVVELSFSVGEVLSVSPTDSLSRLHVEVAENGRLIATGDGPFVTVRRDTTGMRLEVRSVASPLSDPRKPDEESTLRALAKELKKRPSR